MVDIKEQLENTDFILSFGSMISKDNIDAQEAVIKAIAKNRADFIYMHPMDDIDMKVYYSSFLKYEVGSEEGIATMILSTFVKESNEKISAFIEDLDIGYISAESSAGEEELEEIFEKSLNKQDKVLLVGDDVLTHENVTEIIKILSLINKYGDLKVVALDMGLQILIDTCLDEDLVEVQELKSYNGTLIYRYENEIVDDNIVGSNSFARVAKIANKDEIVINIENEKVKKTFIIDKNLQGTIALCSVSSNDNSLISNGYRYKQVKIEKVDCV